MTRPDLCPNCGHSTTAHTGSYCHECGEPLVPERRGNDRRAAHERRRDEHTATVVLYATGRYPEQEPGAVTDLLVDLLHLARSLKLDPAELVRVALAREAEPRPAEPTEACRRYGHRVNPATGRCDRCGQELADPTPGA